MAHKLFEPQPVIETPLTVRLAGDTLVIEGATTATPSMTPAAARATARRLIEAADQLEQSAPPVSAMWRGH